MNTTGPKDDGPKRGVLPHPDGFRFYEYKPHGKAERAVEVFVPLETVQRLTEIMAHTPHSGHATWHFNNPKEPLPCSTCPPRSGPPLKPRRALSDAEPAGLMESDRDFLENNIELAVALLEALPSSEPNK